jgi:hypothetical protein
MKALVFLAALVSAAAIAQDRTESRELVGQLGNRDALLILHATQRADGGWQVAGEYVMVNTLVRRFVEGERGPQLGVTTLKEGTSAILFGRPATGELRGTWRNGVFRGTRFGPGGQERERFEFSEEFPAMDAYSAAVRCEAGGGRYQSTLAFNAEGGKLKPGSFEWTARVAPAGHACTVSGLEQQAFKGGMRLAAASAPGNCAVTLREVGDFVMVSAENCNTQCGSQAYLEPLLVDRRGNCRLLHPEAR